MPSATFTEFNVLSDHLAAGVHNFDSHTLKVMLTNTAPVATNTIRANLTEIGAGSGYSAGGPSLASVTTNLSGATTTLDAADVTITASGGSIGPARYVVVYNDTPTSPADPLIAFADYGESFTILDGNTLTIELPNGIVTIGG